MDNQLFESLIGGPQPEDGSADRSNMASALRGQSDLGMLFSIAPGLEQVGQNMQKGALSQAKQIGDRRQQGLTRTRQAERDKITDARYVTEDERKSAKEAREAAKWKAEQNGWTDIEVMTDPDGNIATYGMKNGQGPLVKIPDSDTLTPFDKYGKRGGAGAQGWRSGQLVSGAKINTNMLTEEVFAFGEKFPNMAAFQEKYPGERLREETGAAGAFALEEELAEGVGQEVTELRTNLAQTNASYGGSEANMRGIINAIDLGANPGQIYAMFPTITNATSLLESLVSAETLGLLDTYQLKPVSDADLAVLRQVAAPGLDGPALKAWAENKIAVLKRAQASGRVFEDWVSDNKKVPRGEERDQLQKSMFAAADAAASDPGQTDLGGDSESTEDPNAGWTVQENN